MMTCSSISAGCTACVALKHGNELYVANAGDSRAVLCRGDGSAYALSIDHKPNDVCILLISYVTLYRKLN